jgi:hypothetical protein
MEREASPHGDRRSSTGGVHGRKDNRLRELGFLFSIAPLGLACESKSDSGEPDLEQACSTYAEHYAECWGDEFLEMAEMFCTQYTTATSDYYGPDCAAVHEALLVCLSAVPCAEFVTLDRYTGDCRGEAEQFNATCGASVPTE